jgi:hypothetical protein
MSILKPTQDAASLDENVIADAVALLSVAAQKNFAIVEARLKAAGFVGISGYEPIQATPNIDTSIAADIGAAVEGRGIYHGAWQPSPNGVIVHAYSDMDLLRDASGKQLLLTWYEARDELARRNDSRRYGAGTELALRQAVAKPAGAQGAYEDGDLVMGPQVLLNGRNVDGDKVRAHNTFDLLSASKGDAFKNIAGTLHDTRSDTGRWRWSCTEDRDYPSYVRAVSLSDGYGDWYFKDYGRLGVLPFRIFREPHVVKAVNHLSL